MLVVKTLKLPLITSPELEDLNECTKMYQTSRRLIVILRDNK